MAQLSGIEHAEDQPQQWINLIKDYTDIEDLDAETLNRLAKLIVVHEEIDNDHMIRATKGPFSLRCHNM